MLIAIAAGFAVLYAWFDGSFFGSKNETILVAMYVFSWVGGIPFAIGWVIRYVATGRTDLSSAPTKTD